MDYRLVLRVATVVIKAINTAVFVTMMMRNKRRY